MTEETNQIMTRFQRKKLEDEGAIPVLPAKNSFIEYLESLETSESLGGDNLELEIEENYDPTYQPGDELSELSDSEDSEDLEDLDDLEEELDDLKGDPGKSKFEKLILESFLEKIDNELMRIGYENSDEEEEEDRLERRRERKRKFEDEDPEVKQERKKMCKEYRKILSKQSSHGGSDPLDYFGGLDIKDMQNLLEKEKLIHENVHSDIPTRVKIINSDLPDNIKAHVIEKINCLERMSGSGSSEISKLNEWISHIMKIPFGKYQDINLSYPKDINEINVFIRNFYQKMDNVVYGQQESKCQLVQIISKIITNPEGVGNCLALQGPPGVGKTTLIKEGLAKAFKRPFNFLSLGGAHDSSYLDGHHYTYEGAIPGQIVDLLQRSNCMNPIFYFDELDKISKTTHGDEVTNLLIHLTDLQQNDKFHDKYLGHIDLDLSKALFIFSYNNDEDISPILKDRLRIVRVKGYKMEDKIKIAQDYALPQLCNELGFAPGDILMPDDVIQFIVRKYAKDEEGVREMKRVIESIISRINLLRLVQIKGEKNDIFGKLPFKANDIDYLEFPLTLTEDLIEKLISFDKKNEIPDSVRHMYM